MIKNPQIFIASDDLAYCREFFAARDVKIITHEDILFSDELNDINKLIADMAGLIVSNALFLSNSSLKLPAPPW